MRVVDDDLHASCAQALEAQEYWRLKGLKADLVILNEHPVSYLDEVQSRLTALLDEGPWRMWKHQPGGAFLLRADAHGPGRARPVLRGRAGGPRNRSRRPARAPRAAAADADRHGAAAGARASPSACIRRRSRA